MLLMSTYQYRNATQGVLRLIRITSAVIWISTPVKVFDRHFSFIIIILHVFDAADFQYLQMKENHRPRSSDKQQTSAKLSVKTLRTKWI